MKVDLHTHTNFSPCADRTNTWQELLKKAESEKIDLLAITDHNTCMFHLMDNFVDSSKFFSGKIVSGVELDVVENGVTFELLAYNFDVKKVFDWTYKNYGTIESRQKLLKEKLLKLIRKHKLKVDEKSIQIGKMEYADKKIYNNMLQFEENLQFFEKYNIKSSADFYRITTEEKNFPLYIDPNENGVKAKDVVSIIHKANGIVILAHPYEYKFNANVDALLKFAVNNGIDGVEVFHPSANNKQIKYLLDFAEKNNLIITGGSDYHGTEKRKDIGVASKYSRLITQQNIFKEIING